MANGVLVESKGLLASLIWSAFAFQYILIPTLMLGWYKSKKRQLYATAPVVGIVPGEGLAAARKRFRTHAQEMLLEGYKKVCYPSRNRVTLRTT